MAKEELRSSPEVRTGFIKGNTFEHLPVQYSVIDGEAIFEGDIVLGSVDEMERLAAEVINETGVAAAVIITGAQFRWPDGIVPFTIDPAFPNVARVNDAIAHWHSRTRIRFVPRTNEQNFVTFRPGNECSSPAGMRGIGQQFITLDSGCGKGSTIHEIGHAVGLWHEQSREDRDQFIRILLENIEPGKEHNFDQHITDGDDVGPYDFGSIMHYDKFAFSKNGMPTIETLNGASIGQRSGLSDGDVQAVNFILRLMDRSARLRTPLAAAAATACVIPGLGVYNIAYRDTSGRLHELWRDAQELTGTTNLTENANAPMAVGNPFAYVDTSRNIEILLFRGGDGTVRSLYWSTGPVGHDNLSGTARAPKAADDPIGYYAAAADTHHVIYRTGDGHLHELYWIGNAPVYYGGNLTGTISAPTAAGQPSAFIDAAGVNHVIYRSKNDGHIRGLYWSDGPSGLDDLSGFAGTPPAVGDPVAYYTVHDDTHQVVYLGHDGHLWELYWPGVAPVVGWDITAPSGAPAAVGTPAAYYSIGTNTKHVIYRSADGRLHEIWWTPGGGIPAHVDLTAFASAPLAADRPAAFTVEGPNSQHVVYRGTDNHIYEIRW